MKSLLSLIGLSLLVFAAFSQQPVLADGTTLKFCDGGCWSPKCTAADTCFKGTIENRSWTVVESVSVEQQQGAYAECVDKKQVHTANLKKGDGFTTNFNKNCEYLITYQTTDGCAGDKRIKVFPRHTNTGLLLVQLRNGCGNLKARRTQRNSDDTSSPAPDGMN